MSCRLKGNKVVITLPANVTGDLSPILKDFEQWVWDTVPHDAPVRNIVFEQGDKIAIMGKDLEVVHRIGDVNTVQIVSDYFQITRVSQDISVLTLVTNFLRKILYERALEKTHEYAEILGVPNPRITIKALSSSLGISSTRTGNFSVAICLVFAPMSVIDYICAHCIANFKYASNPGSDFWVCLEEIFPLHREAEQWIEDNRRVFSIYDLAKV